MKVSIQKAFYYIGVLTSTYVLLRACKFFYYRLRPSRLPVYLQGSKEAWALVTGASDGIGEVFAHELCCQGFNLILHGRNKQKLEKVAASLAKSCPSRQTRLFIADASIPASLDGTVMNIVKDLKLTVLVNNVGGVGHLRAGSFMPLEEGTQEEVEDTINLNVLFTTQLTRILLPTLIRNEPSLMINTGSITSMGMPWLVTYSASKGFLASFSQALQSELLGDGRDIRVHYLAAGAFASNAHKVTPDLFTPDGRTLAKEALRRAGSGPVIMVPHLGHALQAVFLSMLPERLLQTTFIRSLKAKAERVRKSG